MQLDRQHDTMVELAIRGDFGIGRALEIVVASRGAEDLVLQAQGHRFAQAEIDPGDALVGKGRAAVLHEIEIGR